jgi:hypothetical protein
MVSKLHFLGLLAYLIVYPAAADPNHRIFGYYFPWIIGSNSYMAHHTGENTYWIVDIDTDTELFTDGFP